MMTLIRSEEKAAFELNLPAVSMSRGGGEFSPCEDVWILREGLGFKRIDFTSYPQLEPRLMGSLKMVLLWYANNRSASHVYNLHYRLIGLLAFAAMNRDGPISEISHVDLLNYRAHIGGDRQWYIGTIAGMFRRWSDMGLHGIEPAAIALIDELRLKGNRKGAAVLTMDPLAGPLTNLELESLQSSLNAAISRGGVSLSDFVLCWLVMVLGMRPIQYAALKVRDFFVAQECQSTQTYVLRMPRAKTRNAGPREEFSERVLSPELGRLVSRYVECVKHDFNEVLRDVMDAPLFPGDESPRVP